MWVLLFGDVVVDVLLRAGVQFRKNSEFLCHRMKLKLSVFFGPKTLSFGVIG